MRSGPEVGSREGAGVGSGPEAWGVGREEGEDTRGVGKPSVLVAVGVDNRESGRVNRRWFEVCTGAAEKTLDLG